MTSNGNEGVDNRIHCWSCDYLGEKEQLDRNEKESFIKHVCTKCNQIKCKQYISNERYERLHHEMVAFDRKQKSEPIDIIIQKSTRSRSLS